MNNELNQVFNELLEQIGNRINLCEELRNDLLNRESSFRLEHGLGFQEGKAEAYRRVRDLLKQYQTLAQQSAATRQGKINA